MQEDLSAAVLAMLREPETSAINHTKSNAGLEEFRQHVVSVWQNMIATSQEVSRAMELIRAQAPEPRLEQKTEVNVPHQIPTPIEFPREWAPWI